MNTASELFRHSLYDIVCVRDLMNVYFSLYITGSLLLVQRFRTHCLHRSQITYRYTV
jgi:hypothetical protein